MVLSAADDDLLLPAEQLRDIEGDVSPISYIWARVHLVLPRMQGNQVKKFVTFVTKG